MTTLAPVQPVVYGPTWQRDADGKFVLPDKTLGWDVIDWCESYLQQPDGPDAGEPWRFTTEQKRFVVWWYAIDDRGRFIYRAGMLRRMKGWGKNPFTAALCCVEFVGPCRFGGVKRNGDVSTTAHSAAWVQIVATSKDQTRNSMTIFPGMFSRKAIEEYSIDLGKEIIYAHKGAARLESVTSSPRALEGGRATFIVKDETQHWVLSNEGEAMSAVIARNAAKSRDGSSRVLSISNAHAPGEGSDAEKDYEAAMQLLQSGKPSDFLYDSIEAAPYEGVWPPADDVIRASIEVCRGDSVWLDIDRLAAEIVDPHTSQSMARRFYFNQLHAGEDRAFDRERWEQLKTEHTVEDGALIVLGFDGSLTNDWTALIATEVETGYQWPIGIWEPSVEEDGELKIPVGQVVAAVEDAFERYEVWRLNADPYRWAEYLAAWAGKYDTPELRRVVSWSTTLYKRFAAACATYRNAIQEGAVKHDGDARLSAAVGNAHKLMQQFKDDNGHPMWTIVKERPGSPLKIDPCVAAILSWDAYLAAVAAGATKKDEYGGAFWS